MKSKYHALSALIGVGLLPVAGYAEASSAAADILIAAENTIMGLTVEGFYGSAYKDLFKDSDFGKEDVAGLNVRLTYPMAEPESVITPEVFFLAGAQGGSVEKSTYVGPYYEKSDVSLFEIHAAVGANLRVTVCDWFSLVGRAQVGLSWESVDMDASYNDSVGRGHYKKTESDVGLLYGCGLGAEFKLGHGVVLLGVDYVGSTAAPEFSIYGEKLKCEKQSYLTYSVGYKFFF